MHFRETLEPQPATIRTLATPYYLAEQLPASELQAQLDVAPIPGEGDWYPERRFIHVAWACTELALSKEVDDSTANELFEKAEATTTEIVRGEKQFPNDKLDAQLLQAYLPAFHQRRRGIALTTEAKQAIYSKMPAIFDDIEEKEFSVNDTMGKFTKVCTLMMFLRQKSPLGIIMAQQSQNLEVYPASSREHWNQGVLEGFNHDFSAVITGKKVPVIVNTWDRKARYRLSRLHDNRPLIIAFGRTANAAMEAYGLEAGDEVVFDVADMLTKEAEGKKLDVAEHAALDNISSSLAIATLQHSTNLQAVKRTCYC